MASPVFGASLLYTIPAAAENGQLGAALAALGDLDADGIPDLAIGDPAYTEAGLAGSGQVQIVSGATGAVIHTLLGAPAAGQAFGTALTTLDANGDGTTDLAVGATGGCGSVSIYSGIDGSLLRKITPGSPDAGSLYGAALANAGDQNADGKADLFIGAPGASSSEGAVAVASGGDGVEISYITADIPGTQFGASIATVADVNADGLSDMVVGGPAADGGKGRVQLLTSTGSEWTSIFGTVAGGKLGAKAGGVDDRNADGVADVIIGSGSGGSAFLVSGANLTTITDLSLAGAAADLPVVPGGVFDLDANGTTELLVGYPGATPLPKVDVIPDPLAPEPVSFDAASAAGGLGSAITVLPGFGFAFGEPLAEGGAVHVYGEAVPVVDTDGDGVPDDQDQFPNSILDPTVIFGDVDTGVENVVNEDGASLADLFAALEPESGWKNHGQAVSTSGKLIKRLLREGTIDQSEAQALQTGLAQSNLGKDGHPTKPEKPEKPQKPEKPEKPEKPGKPGKPEKPEKPEKPGKGNKG